VSRPSAQSRLLIVIPAWNEEEVLGDVLEMVKAEKPSFADILVVSDGSTDATADIARAAGVSRGLVSMALSGSGRMKEDTRAHILEVARALDYHPHAAASHRRTKRLGA